MFSNDDDWVDSGEILLCIGDDRHRRGELATICALSFLRSNRNAHPINKINFKKCRKILKKRFMFTRMWRMWIPSMKTQNYYWIANPICILPINEIIVHGISTSDGALAMAESPHTKITQGISYQVCFRIHQPLRPDRLTELAIVAIFKARIMKMIEEIRNWRFGWVLKKYSEPYGIFCVQTHSW